MPPGKAESERYFSSRQDLESFGCLTVEDGSGHWFSYHIVELTARRRHLMSQYVESDHSDWLAYLLCWKFVPGWDQPELV